MTIKEDFAKKMLRYVMISAGYEKVLRSSVRIVLEE